MIVARRRDGCAQDALVSVHRRDDAGEDEHEADILFGIFTRIEQVEPRIGGERPVVVLARAVDPFEGLFVQQADHVVLLRDLLHQLHRELVVVNGDVGRRKDGRKLVLRGRDFVVLGLGKDAVRPERLVQIAHKLGDAGLEHAEVVIFQLLSAGRSCAEEGASRQNEVLALQIHVLVDEEVLLLGADGRGDLSALDAEHF